MLTLLLMRAICIKATFYCELNRKPNDQVIRSHDWKASQYCAVVQGYSGNIIKIKK